MQIRILVFLFLNLVFQSARSQQLEMVVKDSLIQSSRIHEVLFSYAVVRNPGNSPEKFRIQARTFSGPLETKESALSERITGSEWFSSDTFLVEAHSELFIKLKGPNPEGNPGNISVLYCLETLLPSQGQKQCREVRFMYGITGISRPADPGRAVSVPASYDPYSQTIKVSVNGGKIDVMNMLGQKVELTFRYDGTGMVADASSLKTGYYFLFGTNEKGPWSARVIVTK